VDPHLAKDAEPIETRAGSVRSKVITALALAGVLFVVSQVLFVPACFVLPRMASG
jgi:hypothetical protein